MKPSFLMTVLVLGLILTNSRVAAQTTISERVRGSQTPGMPVIIMTVHDPFPLSIEKLTKQSDLVMEARVSRLGAHANARDTEVFTDFALHPMRVFAGTLPTPSLAAGGTAPLILTYLGGELVRDGVTVRHDNHGMKLIRDGGVYLLFLERSREKPGAYQIFDDAAFELSDNTVTPVHDDGLNLFRDFSDSYSQITARIFAAAKVK